MKENKLQALFSWASRYWLMDKLQSLEFSKLSGKLKDHITQTLPDSIIWRWNTNDTIFLIHGLATQICSISL